jgi:hypothetical protein
MCLNAVVHSVCPGVPEAESPLLDEDEFPLDSPEDELLPAATLADTASACQNQAVPWEIEPLVPTHTLCVCNSDGEQDLAQWVTCPEGCERCIIQRDGKQTILVLDSEGLLCLNVQRLRCAASGSRFQLTRPSVFQLLASRGLTFSPSIIVLSTKLVLTEAAYRC